MALSKEMESRSKTTSMSLEQPTEEISIGVDLETQDLLLDRLTEMYTDAPGSSVREVISNALDTSVTAGSTRPIEVTLDEINLSLTVRDFGEGMSREDVNNYYGLYGRSSKRKDMNQIGAFGLGAKAPLAYTNEFSVRTIKDGVVTAFTMSRDNTGYNLRIYYVQETDEANGTAVTIPIRANDIARFKDAVESYQTYSFDLPILLNGEAPNLDNWVQVEDVVIHRDEKNDLEIKGRVFLDLNSFNSMHGSVSYSMSLGGWKYNPPRRYGRYYGYRSAFNVIVELKPGVVNFVSSRDSIADDEKSEILAELLESQLMGDTDVVSRALEALDLADHLSDDDKAALFAKFINYDVRMLESLATKLPDELRETAAFAGIERIASYEALEGIRMTSSRAYSSGAARNEYTHFSNRANAEEFISDLENKKLSEKPVSALRVMEAMSASFRDTEILFVTGLNEDNARKFFRARTYYMREAENRTVLLLLVKSKKDGKNIQSALRSHVPNPDEQFVFKTADEIIEDAAADRKARRSAPKKAQIDNFSYVDNLKLTDSEFSVDRAYDVDLLDEDYDLLILMGDSYNSRSFACGIFDHNADQVKGKKVGFIDEVNATIAKAIIEGGVELGFATTFFKKNRAKYFTELVETPGTLKIEPADTSARLIAIQIEATHNQGWTLDELGYLSGLSMLYGGSKSYNKIIQRLFPELTFNDTRTVRDSEWCMAIRYDSSRVVERLVEGDNPLLKGEVFDVVTRANLLRSSGNLLRSIAELIEVDSEIGNQALDTLASRFDPTVSA